MGLAVLVAVAAAVGIALMVLYFVMSGALTDGTVGELPAWIRGLLRHSSLIDTVYLGTALAYIAALAWWRGETRTLLTVFGNGDLKPLGNKLLKIWVVVLALALYLRFLANRETLDTVDGLASRLQLAGFAFAVRVVALLLLLVAVVQVDRQVRAIVTSAASEPAPRVEA